MTAYDPKRTLASVSKISVCATPQSFTIYIHLQAIRRLGWLRWNVVLLPRRGNGNKILTKLKFIREMSN